MLDFFFIIEIDICFHKIVGLCLLHNIMCVQCYKQRKSSKYCKEKQYNIITNFWF